MSTSSSVPSDTVLEAMPTRGLKLLGAISKNPQIRTSLSKRGYTEATHELGWSLVLKASGYRRPAEAANRLDAAAAIAELDAWDEPSFRVARAALVLMPEQRDFLFEGLEAQKGIAAVAAVATFLDRCDELESSKERKATRKADHAALDRLAERGITKEERARLRKLLSVATSFAEAAPPAPSAPSEKATDHREAQVALWAFWTEWSEIAKTDIKRRDHLIQLGLAKRKTSAKARGGDAPGAENGAEASAPEGGEQ